MGFRWVFNRNPVSSWGIPEAPRGVPENTQRHHPRLHDTHGEPPRTPRGTRTTPRDPLLPSRHPWVSPGPPETGEPKPSLGRGVGVTGESRESMTRGGRSGGHPGDENGGAGGFNWRYDTQGFDSTKTHDDTGLPNPPRKKFQKKFFGVQLFFQEKIFCGFGGFLSSWVFPLKPNPCHHGFSDLVKPCHQGFQPKPPCHHGFPPNPPCHTRYPTRPHQTPHDTSRHPPRHPPETQPSPGDPYCPHDTSGFTSDRFKNPEAKSGVGREIGGRGAPGTP